MEKIICFDIETTSVYSSSGIIIAIGVFDPQTMEEPIVYLIKNVEEEANLLNWFKEKIKGHVICGWNSKSFDLPFILGRAVQLGLDFSWLREMKHIDLIEIARQNFRFRSNRMEEVCRLLKVPYQKETAGNEIPTNFMKSLTGDQKARKEIEEKCKKDLIALSELLKKFKPYLITSFS